MSLGMRIPMHKIYNILVRDMVPIVLDRGNIKYKATYLDTPEDMLLYSIRKIKHDITEFASGVKSKNKPLSMNHLVDVQTLVFKLAQCYGYSIDEFLQFESLKTKSNGKYNSNCVMHYIDEPDENDTDEKLKDDCV